MLTNQTGQTKSLQDSNMIEMSAMNNHRQQSPRINISNSDIYSTFNQQQVRKKPPPPPPPPTSLIITPLLSLLIILANQIH